MWLSLVVLLAGADPDSADAKAAFDRMEQQVLKCKTFQVQLEVNSGTGKDAFLSVKGRLLVATGDKVRLELEGSIRGKAEKMAMVSDGTKQRMTINGRPAEDQETKKGLGKLALTSLTRLGVMPAWFLTAPEDPAEKAEFDPATAFPISGLKLGKKESISGVDAQAIEYQVTPRGVNAPISATVWLDIKTSLPVKRVIAISEGKDTITITETYSKATIDGKLDEKELELPK